MSQIERAAADACPSGDPYAVATVTSSTRYTIPDAMAGKFCWFQAVTSDVAVRFGGSSVDVAISARSSVSTEALTAEGSEPHLYLVAGAPAMSVRLDASWTKMAHISADTSGVFRFGPAQGDGLVG